jgi:hypothetical protein
MITCGMSREDYEKLPGLNQSLLKKWIELGESRKKFKHWLDHKDEQPESEALRFGKALDTMIFTFLFFSISNLWYGKAVSRVRNGRISRVRMSVKPSSRKTN